MTAATKPVRFAVACFHFGIESGCQSISTVQDYADAVKKALEALPTVNALQVEVLEHDVNESINRKHFGLKVSDGTPFPLPSLSIHFELSIPERIQKHFRDRIGLASAGTERFAISIYYAYHAPVAFVRPISPLPGTQPSSAVPVIREYLRQEINGSVFFDALGPSPFHADFVLLQREDRNLEAPLVKRLAQHGYDDIVIAVGTDDYTSAEDALNDVQQMMVHELDVFYFLHQMRIVEYREWKKIDERLSPYRDYSQRKASGLRARIAAFFRLSREIAELQADMLSFEIESKQVWSEVSRSAKEVYEATSTEFVKYKLDAEIEQRTEYPTEQTGKLLGFWEQRRLKSFELLVVLIAAVVGGATGALFTLAAAAKPG